LPAHLELPSPLSYFWGQLSIVDIAIAVQTQQPRNFGLILGKDKIFLLLQSSRPAWGFTNQWLLKVHSLGVKWPGIEVD
jgi:hypothetical protein